MFYARIVVLRWQSDFSRVCKPRGSTMNIAVNGPIENMYRVQPLYDTYRNIQLPDCMYKVENIYGNQATAAVIDNVEETNKLDELENSQIKLLQKLEDMKSEVLAMKKELNVIELFEKPSKFQDIVISANPEYPPLSIWVFHQLLAKKIATRLATYVHSSLITMPEIVTQLKGASPQKRSDVSLTVIWKDIGKDAVMVVDPIVQGAVEGEVNIVRYIARLLNFEYEKDPVLATQMDIWLEMAHTSLMHGNNKERQAALRAMNTHLGKNNFFVGGALSLVDIVLWSLIVQTRLHVHLPANVSKWWKNLNGMDLFQLPASLIS